MAKGKTMGKMNKGKMMNEKMANENMANGKMMNKKGKTKKRPLSDWNLFVKKVKQENPNKTFKEVLLMASALKKKGQMTNKTRGKK
jgi:hypothetical protein